MGGTSQSGTPLPFTRRGLEGKAQGVGLRRGLIIMRLKDGLKGGLQGELQGELQGQLLGGLQGKLQGALQGRLQGGLQGGVVV